MPTIARTEAVDAIPRGGDGLAGRYRDLTRCDLRRDPDACFAAFDAWQRQLQVVQPVGFGFIQPLQLVADLIRAANYFTML